MKNAAFFQFSPRLSYGARLLVVPPILGAIAFLIGAIAGCVAICNWDDSAVDMTIVENALAQVIWDLSHIHARQ